MKRILMIAGLSAALVSPSLSQGSPACASSEKWRAGLKSRYGEVPVAAGMGATRPFMIFANPKTGTWTMLGLLPGGACLMGAGSSFEIITPGDPA